MANNSAIVDIIEKITSINGAPCKKTLQKIVFLIEAKHVELGYDYGIHFYGPYSADLDFAVRELCDKGVLKIDYTPMDHLISVANRSEMNNYSNATVDEVIETFGKETPSELELIATALYVYISTKDISRVRDGVIKLKGKKYSDPRIDAAIAKLKKSGYIAA